MLQSCVSGHIDHQQGGTIGTNTYSRFQIGCFSGHTQCHHSDAAKGSLGIKAMCFPMQASELGASELGLGSKIAL